MSEPADRARRPVAARGWWVRYRTWSLVGGLVVAVVCFLWCAGVAAFRFVQGG